MRPADSHQGVSDALQADVMRFMAIIAFCLIAILALVRSIEPPPSAAQRETPPVEPVAVPPPQAPAASKAPAAPKVSAAASEAPAASKVSAAASEAPAAASIASAPAAEPPAPAAMPPAPAAMPPAPAAMPPARTAESPASAPREGLSLRFASERDFLRLVNRREVRLFAFRGGEVLAVDAGFRLRPASAPGELHELLPDTIPDVMLAALGERGGDPWRWGIAMPPRMAAQIRAFVERGVDGELIIDRYGEVRHRGA